MKVKIGKYRNWIGPYQIAKAILFFLPKQKDEFGMECDHPFVFKFGTWLAEDRKGNDSWLTKVCSRIQENKERTIKVHIDEWDTWSMDHTLALIIHPMLVQLQKTKHGSPFVDDEDVPENLRSTSAPPKENEWDIDDNLHKRWEWVMDEMIWAFDELKNDKPGEDKFYTHLIGSESKNFIEAFNKIEIDKEGLTAYQNRMSNAFRLFGKYYQGLWD